MLINSGHTCLFHKGFFSVYYREKENNAVTFQQSTQIKHAFLGKIKDISKTNKLPSSKIIALKLLHQRLGHRSTRSLLDGDIANVW